MELCIFFLLSKAPEMERYLSTRGPREPGLRHLCGDIITYREGNMGQYGYGGGLPCRNPRLWVGVGAAGARPSTTPTIKYPA
jgi:hypothetical protein